MTTQRLHPAEKAYLDRQKRWGEEFARKCVRDGIFRDTDTALFLRSLAQILAKPFDRRLSDLETLAALPSVPPIEPGADSVIMRGHEIVGQAALTATYNTEIPRVELFGTELAQRVYGVALKWHIGYQQIQAAAMSGVPLESKLRDACARVISEHIDTALAFGTVSAGFTGAWNNALVTRWQGAVSVAPDTTPLVGSWALAATTDANILSDVGEMWQNMRTANNLYKPSVLAVGPAEWMRLVMPVSSITYGPAAGLKGVIEMSFPGLEVIEQRLLGVVPAAFRAAGVIGARAVMYEKSDEILYPCVTAGPEEYPPVQTDTGYSVTMHQRTAGVMVPNPLGMIYLDMA